MIYLLFTVHVICCLFLIMVVLLQQGKGADLSAFAGGTTQAAFGARGAATLLHKLTVAFFILFTVTTLTIGLVQTRSDAASVMSNVGEEEATTEDGSGDAGVGEPGEGQEAPAAEAEGEASTPAGETGETSPSEEGGQNQP